MNTRKLNQNIRLTKVFAIATLVLLNSGFMRVHPEEPQNAPLSQRVANSAMEQWPEGRIAAQEAAHRNYELGALLNGMDAEWYNTADKRYYTYIKKSVDLLIAPEGTISISAQSAHALDDALLGRQLLLLYGVTQDRRYYAAATALRHQLGPHPWDSSMTDADEGLDDLYDVEPFLAEYASMFQDPQAFAGITRQFVLTDKRARDARTALSARAMGLYMIALVDTLPYYPANDAGRSQLVEILQRTATEVARYQDRESGTWSQRVDKLRDEQNDVDLSASCMLTYALAKGVRLGYLPRRYSHNAQRAWRGIQRHTISNDPAGMGLLLLAGIEMENAADSLAGAGSTVLLDAWYNSQTRKNAAGQTELYHYKWDDYSNSGFSLLGHIFRSYGVETKTLAVRPTAENLKHARFYLIVSPDNVAKNPNPHYMNDQDATQIAAWVRAGGVLILMENDRDNADIPHLDILADKFGLHFNNVLTHHVVGDQHEMGRMDLPRPAAPFTHAHVLFMKDTCSLSLSHGPVPLLEWKGDTLMATARYGKGTVVAVTDPWLYNEYTDGRNLEPEYDNFAAGREFVSWLLEQH